MPWVSYGKIASKYLLKLKTVTFEALGNLRTMWILESGILYKYMFLQHSTIQIWVVENNEIRQ